MNSKNLDHELICENFWLRRKEFIAMNPNGQVPVLVDGDVSICGSDVIIEYLEEKHSEVGLLGDSLLKRAEVRRIQNWFDDKFFIEVTSPILNERYLNRYLPGAKAPNSGALSIGTAPWLPISGSPSNWGGRSAQTT